MSGGEVSGSQIWGILLVCTVHSRITLQKNLPKLRNLANESDDLFVEYL